MRSRLILILIAVVCLFVSRETLAGAAAIGLRGEQVTQLPEDAGYWQTVVILSGSEEADRSLITAFRDTPRLQRLVRQTTFSALPASHFWCKRNYAGQPLPTVLVMGPNGERVYQAGGQNLPSSGETLASEIATQLDAVGDCPNCPDGRCPVPVRPNTPPDSRPQRPDLRPDKPASGNDGSTLLLIIIVVAVVGYLLVRPRFTEGDV